MTKIKERIGQGQFSIILSIAGNDLFDIEKHKIIKRIKSSRNPLSFHPVVIVADPFLFVHRNELYLFYEEQVELIGKGVIKMTKTRDLKNWTNPTVVLKEEFHLSYPNVFEINGQIFMLPETGNDNCIRLYTPNDDLTQWSLNNILLTGRQFADSDILIYNGIYFLFTTDYSEKTNVLRLYFSDGLNAQWTEHPQSPIAIGKDNGRCGGSIFYYDGKIYRPCQLTQKRYGEGVDLYRIMVLNKEIYIEERIKTIIPNVKKIYREGGHHFNYCKFNNQSIVATDIFEIKFNLIETSRRLKYKITKK